MFLTFTILITFIVLLISYYLFKKASGSMKINELNMLSYIFYFKFLVVSVIGAVLIVNNLVEGGWIEAIKLNQEVRLYGWITVLYVLIMFPVGAILASRVLGVKSVSKLWKNYQHKPLEPMFSRKDSYGVIVVILLSFVSFLSIFYTFYVLGKIPLLNVIGKSAWEIARLRMEAKASFHGITYIRQLAILLTPLVSYMWYAYYILYRKNLYKFVMITYIFLSVLIITYNFEKAPIIFYILGFVFLRIYIYGQVNKKIFIKIFIIILVILIILYVFIMQTHFNELINKIIGRIMISQIVGLFMSYTLFPDYYNFIGFKGLTIYNILTGTEHSLGASKLIMIAANPAGEEAGVSGYMVSLFTSEAWANFGIIGVLLSPLYVGFVIGFFYISLLKQRKTPLTVALLALLSYYWPVTSLLVPFYYNPVLFFLFIIIGIFYIYSYFLKRMKNGGKRKYSNYSCNI